MAGVAALRELSLHILDLIENATRAGARIVYVALFEDAEDGRLEVRIEDDGPGFAIDPEKAADPFYTTKSGKRTGLGLSLLRAAAEQAGGGMHVGVSELGGAAVSATFILRHVDRAPLGDLAGTFFTVVLAHPEIDFCCHVHSDKGEDFVRTADIVAERGEEGDLAIARAVSDRVKEAAALLSV